MESYKICNVNCLSFVFDTLLDPYGESIVHNTNVLSSKVLL